MTRLVTAEELERFPDDDYRYELVEGRLIRKSPVGFDHGKIVAQIIFLLRRHLMSEPAGVVVTEVGFKLASNPDTVRGPDVSFIRNDRIPPPGVRGFLKGTPDAVFEVLSPDDRPSDFRAKIAEYLENGVPRVVVIDPDEKTVTSLQPTGAPVLLRADDDLLDLSDVITGFSCRVREIFE